MSTVVTGEGVPPLADTCEIPELYDSAATIVPSWFQLPPRPSVESQIVTGEAPPTSIRFNLSCVKKAIERLSGDQKGNTAPSVPGTGCEETESSARR